MQNSEWERGLRSSAWCRGAMLLLACSAAVADTEVMDPAYKLTVGQHFFTTSGTGTDVNLRRSSDGGNLWVGYFQAVGLDASQWRAGWDQSYGDRVRVQPSLQVASGGFVGGSINFETGTSWFLGAGLGRTNLQPYYNLNFDPNDSWTLSAGYRSEDGSSYSLGYIRDNRENPDQQHLHFVLRQSLEDKRRLTLDILLKRGLVDGEAIQRVGATLTYDWPRYFVRLAFDPNTNFTADDVTRLSIGARF